MALVEPAPRRRMLVIINPVATRMSGRLKSLVVYALQGRYDVTTAATDHKGHAIELCRAAVAEDYDVVVAFGGDGTVNEAANGLAGTDVALTCLPAGSNNVLAKLLGIPTDVVDATEHLLLMADRWAPRKVDLGVVNGRHFAFAAGMGLDASVVERVDANPRLKTRFGPFYFAGSAVTTFLSDYVFHPPRLRVEADGHTVEGVSLFVQNAENYTYFNGRPIPLVEGAHFDSGTLAGVVLERARPHDVPTVTIRALSGAARVAGHRHIDAFGAFHEAVVTSLDDREIPIHVDGDHFDDVAEARFSVAPGALHVVA